MGGAQQRGLHLHPSGLAAGTPLLLEDERSSTAVGRLQIERTGDAGCATRQPSQVAHRATESLPQRGGDLFR